MIRIEQDVRCFYEPLTHRSSNSWFYPGQVGGHDKKCLDADKANVNKGGSLSDELTLCMSHYLKCNTTNDCHFGKERYGFKNSGLPLMCFDRI